MNGYQALANAVVEQAAEDYKKALCEVKKWQTQLKECEAFFKGEYIEIYTKLDGVTLMHAIEEDVKACNYQYVDGKIADPVKEETRKALTKMRRNLVDCLSTIEILKANK